MVRARGVGSCLIRGRLMQSHNPDALLPYFRFVQRNVQEYTNDRVPLTKTDYLNFVRFMAGNGLSAGTAASIARQLIAEKKLAEAAGAVLSFWKNCNSIFSVRFIAG